jgi:hypothetical protein
MLLHAPTEQSDLTERECHRTCYHQTKDWNQAIFSSKQETTWPQWCRDKCHIHILTNMHNSAANTHFLWWNEIYWQKWQNDSQLLNTKWKWTKSIFHLLDFAILNGFFLQFHVVPELEQDRFTLLWLCRVDYKIILYLTRPAVPMLYGPGYDSIE